MKEVSAVENCYERLDALRAACDPRVSQELLELKEAIAALSGECSRLQKEATGGRIIGWRLVDGLRVFTANGHTPGATQEFVTLADYERLHKATGRMDLTNGQGDEGEGE